MTAVHITRFRRLGALTAVLAALVASAPTAAFATARLYSACSSGTHYDEATTTIRR